MKKKVSLVMLTMLLIGMLALAFNMHSAKGEPRTWIVDDDGSADFHTIQEAINHANEEDTIFVRNGTYYEHVVVNKSISLLGESRGSTIIDGSGSWKVVHIIANWVRIEGFTIRNGLDGIHLEWTSGSSIVGNAVMYNTRHGIWLAGSGENTIMGNLVTSNGQAGIAIDYSAKNILKNNNMAGNSYNFALLSSRYPMVIDDFIQDIDISNTVDGKPLYYWVNQSNRQVPLDAGYVAIINSTNILVRDLNLTTNGQGVLFSYTSNSTIENVNASKNIHGIFMWASNNNIIRYNELKHNGNGISIESSNGNILSDNRAFSNINTGILGWHSGYNTLSFNEASENYYGIVIRVGSNSNIISNNAIAKNIIGIQLEGSCYGNYITENTLASNYEKGMVLTTYVANNAIYHNNFLGDPISLSLGADNNTWDNGYPSGGNYWSDYMGVDLKNGPNQNLSGSDGIGDTPYSIDAHNIDHYPLIVPSGARPPSYTITVYSSPAGVTFTVDSVSHTTSWSGTYIEGASVSLEMPEMHSIGEARYYWSQWNDGVTSRTRTVTMETNITLTGIFVPAPPPVGGYSVAINAYVTAEPLTPYLTLIAILTISFTTIRRKTHKKIKQPSLHT